MPSRENEQRSGDPWLGIFFLGTCVLVLLFSGSIQSIGLGNNFDPGPKSFPIGLSLLLAAGGAVEFFKRKTTGTKEDTQEGKKRTVLLLLGAFLIYVFFLPWLGFALSTGIMATLMMILLGHSWKCALPVSVVLIAFIYILFVVLLKVPLPGGIFGMPF